MKENEPEGFLFKKKLLFDTMSLMAFISMDTRSVSKAILPFILLFIVLLCTTYAQQPTAETFFAIGMQNSENTEYAEAIDAFKHAIKLKPDYAEAHYNLGNVYYNLHRYTESIDAYKEAIRIKPDYTDAYTTLGVVSLLLSRHDEAIGAFKRSVKINPKNPEVFYNLGNAYSEINKYEEAADAFKQAVKLKPKFAEAHYRLGFTYIELSKKALNSARKEYNVLKRQDKELAKDLLNALQKKK